MLPALEPSGNTFHDQILNAVANGIPLPKGHGDLIDRQALIDNGIEKGFCDWYDEIKYADTIIKAHLPTPAKEKSESRDDDWER